MSYLYAPKFGQDKYEFSNKEELIQKIKYCAGFYNKDQIMVKKGQDIYRQHFTFTTGYDNDPFLLGTVEIFDMNELNIPELSLEIYDENRMAIPDKVNLWLQGCDIYSEIYEDVFENVQDSINEFLNKFLYEKNNGKRNAENFMSELLELTKKYGLAIGGCGCCGSPYIYGVCTGDCYLNEIQYDNEKLGYDCKYGDQRH